MIGLETTAGAVLVDGADPAPDIISSSVLMPVILPKPGTTATKATLPESFVIP